MTPFFVTRRSDDLCLEVVFVSWLDFFFLLLASGTFTGLHLVLLSQGYYFGWRQRRWIKKHSKQCPGRHSTDKKEARRTKTVFLPLWLILLPLDGKGLVPFVVLHFCFVEGKVSVCRSSIDFLFLRFSSVDDEEGCNIRREEPSSSVLSCLLEAVKWLNR